MAKTTDEINAFLGKGTEFEGKLKFDGTVRIDGSFKGEIEASGTLIIGEGAKVDAEISCGSLITSGQLTGNINASQKVEALAPARIQGNIKTPVLIINEGVFFDGTTQMQPNQEESNRERKGLFPGKREKAEKEEGKTPVHGPT